MNTKRLARFWIALIIGVLSISQLWAMNTTQPTAAAQSSIHKLNAESVDMLAHAVGSEWHDKSKSPLVVDFDKTSPNTPSGMNQWLASQGKPVSPRANVFGTKKYLILRVYFDGEANDSYYAKNAAGVDGNHQWSVEDDLMKPLRETYRLTSYNQLIIDWDISNLYKLPKSRYNYINSSTNNTSDGCVENNSNGTCKLDQFGALFRDATALAKNDFNYNNYTGILILMSDTKTSSAFHRAAANQCNTSWYGFALNGVPNNTKYGCIVALENHEAIGASANAKNHTRVELYGRFAHEFGHAFQQAGPPHPSNYNNSFELMDSNYPGHVGAYEKQSNVAFPGWMPTSQYIQVSKTSKTQNDSTCIRALEYDPSLNPVPQAIKVSITGSLYYMLTVRIKDNGATPPVGNGDDLNAHFPTWAPGSNNPVYGIPSEGLLIERVDESATGNNQVVTVIPKPSFNRDRLWVKGETADFFSTDGVKFAILPQAVNNPDKQTMCVRISFDATNSLQPDVAMRPWREAPGQTWETTDIWFDSPLNGYGTYRYGFWNDINNVPTPQLNGDIPAAGSVNRVYARVRNVGTKAASDIVVRFQVTDPPGMGINASTNWIGLGANGGVVDKNTFPALASLAPGAYTDVYVEWTPQFVNTPTSGTFNYHTCVRVKIDPVVGEQVLGNQDGNDEQENIFTFEATPAVTPKYEQKFTIFNESVTNPITYFIKLDSTLPTGWQVKINDGVNIVKLDANQRLEVPVVITPTGSAVLGSIFETRISAEKRVDLINTLDTDPTNPNRKHSGSFEFSGVSFAVNVLADTSITCQGYIQDGRVSVVGTLDGFQGIHQAGTPLRAYAQLYDNSGNAIALDDRATGDVGANGVFRMNFSTYRSNKGQALATPKSVRCLFPGTHLLASSGSQTINLVNQVPPTATIVPWFASQFHANLALNMQSLPYGSFACPFVCPVLVGGKHARAGRLIDTNSSIFRSSANVNLGASYSASIWARRTRNNQAETLISHGSTFLTGQLFNMGFTDSNQVVCSTFNDELLSTTIISDREWHHYVCVVSGNQRRLYIDGALDGSRTAAVPNYAQNATLYVGRRMDVARAFEGTIDELGIYSFAINAGQVGQLYALDPNMAIASVGASFDDVVIAESNGVFSYCINQTCPQVYYPDVYYPDRAGNPTPTTSPAIDRPNERFAAVYMEPNHPMSYGASVAPFPGTDSSLMFWARLDDASNNSYPLVQSVTNPYVNRPSVSWTGNTHTLQYANLNYAWNNYDNKWHLFTFVKRGATLELYIDNNRVIEGAAPAGLQPFRVAAGSTINVGGVSGGEIAAVELSPLAYPNDYIKWRYENGIPNFATAQPTITPQNTLTPTASPTVTASMTPTGTFSSATRTWYKLTVVNPILTAISSNQTAVASATQAAQQGINNALTTTRVVQLQTQVANDGQTATSVSQTQVAANATATSLVATEAAQLRATLAGTAIKTATRPIIVVPTFIIIGFPTLFPTYTNTPTVTNSPTRNASFTATRTRTVTASRTATSTFTNTRTVTRTVSRTSTRTRMSTPTFVTMTATVTMSPTAISTMYGPDTVFINRLPAGMLARALQFIQDQRMNPCSSKDIACPADDWRDPVINDVAIPFYRPDIMGGAMPAYYELSLYDRTTKQPKGFIMMAMDYGKSVTCGNNVNDPLCGIVDYPIAHWNSSGPASSAQLTPSNTKISTDGLSEYKLWKLDALSYVAIQNNSVVSSLGAFPLLISNLQTSFQTYGNTQGDGDTTWSPDNPDVSDNRKPDETVPEPIHSGIDDDKADQTWKFNDIDIKGNFDQYISKYPLSFAPLLTQLKQDAKAQWLNERKLLDPTISGDQSDPLIPRYNVPVQANSVTSIVLPFRGVSMNNITNETPSTGEPLIKFSLDTNSLFGYSVLTITTGDMPRDTLPRLRLFIRSPTDYTSSQGPYQNTAKYTFFLTDKVTQVCPSGDYCPLPATMKSSRGWAPWRSYWAGTGADQRNYDQFDVGGGCQSGCGPTAWMMLFGWVDYKSSPAPSYAASSVWPRRWNTYHAGGNNTGATFGSTGTAPQSMDDGVRNAVRYIRNVVDTFCFPFSNSGATVPWKMDRAANYLSYVGTGMSLDTHYNIVGVHEDRLTRYALESLSNSNPRPVVIGIGLLSHYPLAWGIQYTTRPENWNEGWFDGDDVVWYQYWYVNEGWGGRNNGWIQTGTWFAGRVNP